MYVVLNSCTWNVKLFIYLLFERIRDFEYLVYLTKIVVIIFYVLI